MQTLEKNNHLKLFLPAKFFVIRMPFLSFDNFFSLNDAIKAEDISLIKKYWNNPIFLNAIYLASKEFYHVALKWLQNKEIVFDPSDSIFQSLYKYYIRMCSRCTPYGLFSGYAFGKISEEYSDIEIKNDNIIPSVRTDILFLRKLKDRIISEAANSELPLFKNNTIYSFGTVWRYISWNKNYNYEISEIAHDPVLDGILELAVHGTTISDISNFIQGEVSDIAKADIDEYIELLVENNILVDRLPPYMTSMEDPLAELEDYLRQHSYDTEILKPIIDIQNKIYPSFFTSDRTINDIDILMKSYRDFVDESYQIFQIDSKVNLKKNVISEDVVNLLAKRGEELFPLISQDVQPKMQNFINRFYQKFETREVPLILALDPDYGVGYDHYISGNLEETPLLDDLYFTFGDAEKSMDKVSPLLKYILNKFIDCFSVNAFSPIILSEEDVKNIRPQQNNKIPSFGFNGHISGFFICESLDDLNGGNFRFFPLSTLPTGNVNEILSRFAYHDVDLRENLELITESDTDNCIFVELLHHREDRLANVLVRPNFYNYELPYVSESKSDPEQVISINDILIRYIDGKIRLRSKRLNKEIKPRYSNAYNYDDNQLPVINFLGDYQYYGINPGFRWDWGFLITNDFLPRIEYKEFILIEARWKIDKDENITIEKLKSILKSKHIPRLCTYKRSDNVLLLDTSNEVCLHILAKLIAKFSIILNEYLQSLQIPNESGEKFVSEFVFPLVFNNTATPVERSTDVVSDDRQRKYLPGEDWSFFKIYTSHKYADVVIKEVIREYIGYLENKGNDCEWYFIRYSDPDFHVRFRIKTKLTGENMDYLNRLLKDLINQGAVSSVVIDTYIREIERYGSDNIEFAERYFHYDSLAILEVLSVESELNENIRWQIAILSLHLMMEDFEITLEERIKLFDEYFQGLLPENVDVTSAFYMKKFKASMDKKYRENRDFVDGILRQNNYKDLNEYMGAFKKRSLNTAEIIKVIKSNTKQRFRYLSMVKDYVHMNMNRIFLTKARMHEFVVYFLMYKTYNSIYHRNKKA